MNLNILHETNYNGLDLQFGTNPESEKFSLFLILPSHKVEITTGKGSKKKVVGYEPATFSKRSIGSVMDFQPSDIPDRHFLKAVDENTTGLRGMLGKSGITSASDLRSFFGLVSGICENLTPKAGSVADPLSEAKRVFSKTAKYDDLNLNDPMSAMLAWYQVQVENLDKIMAKAKEISIEDYRTFCEDKFLANGTDEDGYLRLKKAKGSESED